MIRLAMAAGALLAAGSATAATVTVTHFYNPANVLPLSLMGEALATPFTLGLGDTLDFTLKFSGPSIGTLTGETAFWLLALTSGPAGPLGVSGTFEFLNPSANLVSGPFAVSGTDNSVHVGRFLPSNLYRLDSNPISFTGVRTILTVNSSAVGPRQYDRVSLTHLNGQFSFAAVPEPASWAMLITGFGLVGAAARRRRTAIAA